MSQKPPVNLPPIRPNSEEPEHREESVPVNPNPTAGGNPLSKEQYSLEEMMKTLRDQEREKEEQGEMVTRSDGSVARKVRRRRRRSNQPDTVTPEKVRKKILFRIVLAVSLVLISLVGIVFLIVAANGTSNREKLQQQASDWTESDVEFKGLKLLPYSVTMSEASFEWPSGYYLEELNLRNVEGKLNFFSYFGARPSGLQIGGQVGELKLRMPEELAAGSASLDPEEFPFEYDRYFCKSLDVTFGESEDFGVSQTDISLRHIIANRFEVTLNGGTFRMAGWPELPIAAGHMNFEDDGIDLKALTLTSPQDGESSVSADLTLKGKIPLEEGSKAELILTSNGFPFRHLADERLSALFDGMISSTDDVTPGKEKQEAMVTFTVGNDRPDEVIIPFTAEYLTMQNFPFLENLKTMFPNENFEVIDFDTGLQKTAVNGMIKIRPEESTIENLKMTHRTKLRMRGNVSVRESGEIDGEFTLWINQGLITDKLRTNPLFAEKVDTGWIQVEFELGGTLDVPDDTFREVIGLKTSEFEPGNESGTGDPEIPDFFNEDIE